MKAQHLWRLNPHKYNSELSFRRRIKSYRCRAITLTLLIWDAMASKLPQNNSVPNSCKFRLIISRRLLPYCRCVELSRCQEKKQVPEKWRFVNNSELLLPSI